VVSLEPDDDEHIRNKELVGCGEEGLSCDCGLGWAEIVAT
jgi:hypothetical protein